MERRRDRLVAVMVCANISHRPGLDEHRDGTARWLLGCGSRTRAADDRARARRQYGEPGACRVLANDQVKAVVRGDSIWLPSGPIPAMSSAQALLLVRRRTGTDQRRSRAGLCIGTCQTWEPRAYSYSRPPAVVTGAATARCVATNGIDRGSAQPDDRVVALAIARLAGAKMKTIARVAAVARSVPLERNHTRDRCRAAQIGANATVRHWLRCLRFQHLEPGLSRRRTEPRCLLEASESANCLGISNCTSRAT